MEFTQPTVLSQQLWHRQRLVLLRASAWRRKFPRVQLQLRTHADASTHASTGLALATCTMRNNCWERARAQPLGPSASRCWGERDLPGHRRRATSCATCVICHCIAIPCIPVALPYPCIAIPVSVSVAADPPFVIALPYGLLHVLCLPQIWTLAIWTPALWTLAYGLLHCIGLLPYGLLPYGFLPHVLCHMDSCHMDSCIALHCHTVLCT